MPTDLGSLEPQLKVEIGETVSFLDRMNLLRQSVPAFNGMVPRPFALSGTTLERDATPLEARTLVVISAWLHAKGKYAESADQAIVHSNAAGRTDLTGVTKAWENRIADYEQQLGIGVSSGVRVQGIGLIARLSADGVDSETTAAELGETKDIVANRPLVPLSGLDAWIY